MINWYTDTSVFYSAACRLRQGMDAIEDYVESRETIDGYCTICSQIVTFRVSAGVMMGEHVSLREGMICSECGVSSRSRLLYEAVEDTLRGTSVVKGALLESITPLATMLLRKYPSITLSEYLGPDIDSGTTRLLRGVEVRHESLLNLSYADQSLDFICHNDVLEHVYDFSPALRESMRVLRSGASAVFAMPFFPFLPTTQVRGRLDAGGAIEHIEPPEYHGDGVTNEGIYTFYHFGLDFIDSIREAGFGKVEIGLAHDVFRGYLSSNYRYGDDGVVLPIIFRATR